jgi:beta-lactamase regulating signal transducer with metallopeptidase domain
MIDLIVKMAIAAALAWLFTRRVTPANAAAAHRLWLVVVTSPVLWLAGQSLFAPVAYARLRTGALPESLSAPSAGAWEVAAAVYVTVAALLLLRALLGVISVRRLLAGALPLSTEELTRLRAIASAGPLQIREGELDIPVTAGFFNPVIVLPGGWRAISPAGMETILRHEAAHVRRRDCAVSLACAVLEAVCWFSPAMWLASAQVRWFAEMACDAEAARAMDDQAYAAELLSLAAGWSGARRPRYAITAGAETSVATRIRLLLDEMEQGGGRRRMLLPIAAVLLMVAVPIASTLRVGAATGAGSSTDADPHATLHQHRHAH